MPKKISIDELMAKMADLDADQGDLSEYFIVDEDASRPFAPQFRLNPQTVAIPRGAEGEARSAAAMNGANWFARMHRQGQFYKRLRKGYEGPIIVSEGDSWFQYPLLLRDTIDHLMKDYAIFSLGAAGDLLQNMADKSEFIGAIRDKNAEILLLSGGGNDLVAGGALALHLEEFDAALQPADYLLPSFQALLDNAIEQYTRMFEMVRRHTPHVKVLCHGYDYPVPNRDRWLGKPMESRGIKDRDLQKAIAACMMDQFNRRLRRAAKAMPHVTYIDCRRVVKDHRWHDGLHPTNEGYADVAALFKTEIAKFANNRAGAPVQRSGPFGDAGVLRSKMEKGKTAADPAAGPAPKGMSLHLGLDTVDPAHYAGWDGALQSCEADAKAMQRLAKDRGFETDMLLTSAATRAAVIDKIKDAAGKLHAGDMFLMTVSAHGGRIPDFNQDEDHDGDEKMDETLCLFDFQLADDELYMLWGEFRAGVRILMVPDTCHSGSMVRVGPLAPTTLFGQTIVPPHRDEVRAMPLDVEEKTWMQNREAYRDASRSYSAMKESVMMSPLTSPVKASVLNLGACKDTQFAGDGPDHGAFTGALLAVWNDGRFAGDYRAFRAAIDARIGSDSQTPQIYDQLHKAPHFIGDVPFTIGIGKRAREVSPVHAIAAIGPVEDTEGIETDSLPDEDVRAIFEAKRGHVRMRSGDAALNWSDYGDFNAFITGLGLRHFGTDEFLVLGGAHSTPGGGCAGLNTYPPRSLWPNIAATARALDALRAQLGRPIAITNAYRAPAYNSCIDGAASSLHMQFNALDFKVSRMAAPDVAMALRWLRDKEGLFSGGVGRYNSFTHIDTRGSNATWFSEFKNAAVPIEFPMPAIA